MNTRFIVSKGDITKMQVDAVVNAANSELRPGNGVCGAIYEAAGLDELHAETKLIGSCSTGKAVVSKGHNLHAKIIIHAVGPIYREVGSIQEKAGHKYPVARGLRGEDILLSSAYRNSLIAAHEAGARTIAFPCISTGVYGFPLEPATDIAVDTCMDYATTFPDHFDEIHFVCFKDEDEECYVNKFAYIRDLFKHHTQPATSASVTATTSQVTGSTLFQQD